MLTIFQPDNIAELICEKMPEGYKLCSNISAFQDVLQKETNAAPFGEILHQFMREPGIVYAHE